MELFGYGLKVSLKHPSQLARVAPEQAPQPDTVVLARPSVDDVNNVVFVPGNESKSGPFERVKFEEGGQSTWGYRQEEGGTEVVLRGEMDKIDKAASLEGGDEQREWTLRAEFDGSTYTSTWPESYNLITTPDNRPWPFELHGHDRSMMYVQGPIPTDRASDLEDFVREGQNIVSQDDSGDRETLVLEYDYNDETWRQYHQKFEVGGGETVVVSMQCPATSYEEASEFAEELADSIEFEG